MLEGSDPNVIISLIIPVVAHDGTPRTPSTTAWGMRYTAYNLLLRKGAIFLLIHRYYTDSAGKQTVIVEHKSIY